MLVLLLTWRQQGLPSHISYSFCSWGIKEHLPQQRSSQNAGRFAQTNMCSSKFKYLNWKGSKWVSPSSQSVPSLQEYAMKKWTSLVLQLPPNASMGRVLQTVLHDENKSYSTLSMPRECLPPCTSLEGKGKAIRKQAQKAPVIRHFHTVKTPPPCTVMLPN